MDIDLETLIKDIAENRTKILEDFARAYLAETEYHISEIELVEEELKGKDGYNTLGRKWYFRKKNKDEGGLK